MLIWNAKLTFIQIIEDRFNSIVSIFNSIEDMFNSFEDMSNSFEDNGKFN